MAKRWGCPICEQTCSRNWNMERHIERKHNGLGEAVDLLKFKNLEYMNRNGILNQDALHSYNKIQTKEDEKIKKPYQTSADLTEKIILQPLRMLREFKQLLDDLFPTQQQQKQRSYFPAQWTWSSQDRQSNGNSTENYWSQQVNNSDHDNSQTGFSTFGPNINNEKIVKDKLVHDLKNRAAEKVAGILDKRLV